MEELKKLKGVYMNSQIYKEWYDMSGDIIEKNKYFEKYQSLTNSLLLQIMILGEDSKEVERVSGLVSKLNEVNKKSE